MAYRLYGWRQTGSMAVEAMVALAGIAHSFVPVSRATDENRGPAFTAINPRQQLPALVCADGTVVTEGPAILTHLADAHPAAGLIPAPGSMARARHDRWMAFLHANIYEAMLREMSPGRYTDDPQGAAGVQSAATSYVRQHFMILEGQLGPGPFLNGDRIQAFDIYLWMLTWWVDSDWLGAACPGILRLREAAQARPALAAVWARHFG
jgi:GST-like protein